MLNCFNSSIIVGRHSKCSLGPPLGIMTGEGQARERSHASVMADVCLSADGQREDGGLLDELSTALNAGHGSMRAGLPSTEELLADVEQRYLTPKPTMSKELIGSSQM